MTALAESECSEIPKNIGKASLKRYFWSHIKVDSTYNIKKKTKAKTLDQIMKRINIFKSRLDTLDRNPILKKILEKDSRDNSQTNINEDEEKKEKNKGEEEFVYYSYRKKMQAEYQKLLKEKQDKKKDENDPKAKAKKNVVSRLVQNKKDQSEESTIKIDDNLKIKYESGKKLYHELSKAKTEKEYRQIARTHWTTFKANYKKSLQDLKSHQFIQSFVKENKKYNIYLPDFNKEKKKNLNIEEDEAKQKEMTGEDDEIFSMIDKIMSGAVYEKWRSLQDKDL